MDVSIQQFIELVNLAINNKSINLNVLKEIDWESIRTIAHNNCVDGIIYLSIREGYSKDINEDLLNEWKKETLMNSLYINRFIINVANVIEILQSNGIELIALKGLYLRNLYPNKDLRTMSDADILVHEDDLDKISKILIKLGFKEGTKNNYHIEYYSGENIKLEIHWTLEKHIKSVNEKYLNKDVWSRAINIKVGETYTKGLSIEDLFIYMISHMASHMVSYGFGIRQIIDLVLLIKNKGNEVNWNKLIKKLNEMNLKDFFYGILGLSNKFFYLDIPKEVEYKKFDDNEINKLAEYIILNGVYGNKNIDGQYRERIITMKREMRIIDIIKLFFPYGEKLSDRYSYVKNNKLFLPIAWVDRWILILKNINKIRTKKVIKLVNEKEEILSFLGL